ncbi:MAG: acyltransferase [Eubacteriales bacterium]|nr:acyltransferase [Eubacteriales bacterium]
MKRERQANLEALRILAMVMVVTAHLMNHGNLITLAQPGTASYYLVWTLFGVSFVCINLYLLISSYFLVESRFSVGKLVRLILQVFFYSFGITLLFWLFTDVPKEPKYLVYSVLPVASDFYWFVSMYVGMYLLSPLMNRLVRSMSKRQLCCAALLSLGLVSVWPNIIYFSSALNTAGGVSISWFLTLYLCGAYLRLYYRPDGRFGSWLWKAFAALLLIPASRFIIEALLATPLQKISILDDLMWGYSVFYNYSSILVTLASILLFLAFLNLRIAPGKGAAVINTVAGAAFGVYLIHDHYYIREKLWSRIDGGAWLGKWYLLPACIGTVAAVYLVCTGIELLRQRIFCPLEKSKWLTEACLRADEGLRRIWRGEEKGEQTENEI